MADINLTVPSDDEGDSQFDILMGHTHEELNDYAAKMGVPGWKDTGKQRSMNKASKVNRIIAWQAEQDAVNPPPSDPPPLQEPAGLASLTDAAPLPFARLSDIPEVGDLENLGEVREEEILDFTRRKQREEFEDLRRDERLQDRLASQTRQAEIKQQRTQLRDMQKERRAEFRQSAGLPESRDRIVRRLSAFGIGRTAFGSGQGFAALAEALIFSPQERAAEDRASRLAEVAASAERQENEGFENELLASRQADLQREAQRSKLFEDANRQLRTEQDPERRDQILQDLRDNLADVQDAREPASFATSATSRGGGAGVAGGGGTGGGGTGGLGGFAFGSGGGEGGGLIDSVSSLIGGTDKLTLAFLATNVAVTGLAAASEAASKFLREAGQAFVGSPEQMTQRGMSLGLSAVGGAGKNISAGVGAGVGAAVAGPPGLLLGAAIGKAAGAALIDPLITGIESGYNILADATRDSMGVETIFADADQSLKTLIKKFETDVQIDAITAEFRRAQGEFSRTMLELRRDLIETFGDELIGAIRAASIALQGLVNGGTAAYEAFQSSYGNVGAFGLFNMMRVYMSKVMEGADAQLDIADQLREGGVGEERLQDMMDFFMTTEQDDKDPRFRQARNATSLFMNKMMQRQGNP